MKIIKHFIDVNKIIIGYTISNIMKIKKGNRDIWLISERRNEAEDNGYYLYKYIRENQPSQKIYYVIDKDSKSYHKIANYGSVIQYDSIKHYIYYFLCNKHISAFQFFGVPETPILWKLEELKIIKKEKVFLQHGIIKEDLPFLKYEKTNYRLFICGAKKEYEYVSNEYNYPDGYVVYTGLARYDNLYEHKDENIILLMPTWRQWFGMTSKDRDDSKEHNEFIESNYFKVYNSLLHNEKINNMLKEKNIKLVFYPHPEMQRFINCFSKFGDNIVVADRKNSNLQELLKKCKLLITDYSSIAFDGAYMEKSIIYYQFDSEEYYSKHFTKGYFDCDRDGFGPVIKNESELLDTISKVIDNSFDLSIYKLRAREFFPLHDTQNCKRNYEAIKNI